jgi:hypothetical protein
MLLPEDIHPKNSVYYNGAIVLKELSSSKTWSLTDLYSYISTRHKMSFAMFILCLDWLFLIDIAIVDSQGKIKLCS